MFLDAIWSLGQRIETSTQAAVQSANPSFQSVDNNDIFQEVMDDVAGTQNNSSTLQARLASQRFSAQAPSLATPTLPSLQNIAAPTYVDSGHHVINGSQKSFIKQLLPYARRAGTQLGINPLFIVSQAALETGWGQRMIKGISGQGSFNVFGIKALPNLQKVEQITHEFVNGRLVPKLAEFSQFHSLTDSFDAYAHLLNKSPAIQAIQGKNIDIHGFSKAITQMGYATDPQYGKKLIQVFNKVNQLIE